MILPTAEDVLQTAATTLETLVFPGLAGGAERSAAATVGHLLRHVRQRLADEGQILFDDIAALRPLLADIEAFFAGQGEGEAATALRVALDEPGLPPGVYPSLARLGAAAGRLRAALEVALARLQDIRPLHGGGTEYEALRAGIRAYIALQVTREAQLVEPAFAGQGPRR